VVSALQLSLCSALQSETRNVKQSKAKIVVVVGFVVDWNQGGMQDGRGRQMVGWLVGWLIGAAVGWDGCRVGVVCVHY